MFGNVRVSIRCKCIKLRRLTYKIFHSFHRHLSWSLALKEERRLRVFEKRVLRSIFGPKRDKLTGDW
jgi:hypothetical protein